MATHEGCVVWHLSSSISIAFQGPIGGSSINVVSRTVVLHISFCVDKCSSSYDKLTVLLSLQS